MERQAYPLEKAPSFTKETHPNIVTIAAQAAAAAAQHRSKAEKEIEKLDKDREQKNKEREKEIEKEIDKIERDRDKSVEKASQEHQPSTTSNLLHLLPSLKEKDLFVDSQKARLRELFSQIEKEFELLWEENQDLRRKLEDSYSKQPSTGQSSNSQQPQRKDSGLGSRLNPLKKKEGKSESSEWERLTHFIGHRDGIWEVSPCNWEKNSNSFATASVDRTARVWTSDASRPVYIYVGHKGSVNSVRFHPTSRLVCTASGDNTAHIWRLPKPEERKDKPKEIERERERDSNLKPWTPVLEKDELPSSGVPLSQSPNVETAVAPNPALNITAGSIEQTDDGVSTFGVVTISRAALELKHKNVVSAADWLYPGDKIVTGSWDGMVRLWSAENGRCIHELGPTSGSQTSIPIAQQYDSFFVTNVTVHKASSLALASYSDGSFRIFDFRSEKPSTVVTNAHSELVSSVCFGVDDNLVLSGSDDRTVKIWDRRNMKVPKTIIRCHASLNRFSVSPINSYLAIPMDDMATKVCDLNGKYVLGRIKSEGKNGHKAMVTCAAWSIDESVVFTAGFDRSVIAWGKPRDRERSERSKLTAS